jgi:hypothetical protein
VRDPGRGDHLAGLDRAVEGVGDEVAVVAQRGDVLVLDGQARLGREPLRVGEEDRERDRVLADLLLVEVALEGQRVRVVEVPVGAGAQEHARGHVVAPEGHVAADDPRAQALVARGLGGGEPVGPRPDDENVDQTFSRTASPWPPPPHSVATP